MLNLLFWILVMFILVNLTERILGNRKTEFIEAFFTIGFAIFWVAHTFFETSLLNIVISAFLILVGIKWLLDARRAQDERCCYCGKHVLFWQKSTISMNPLKCFHKKCKNETEI